MEEDGDLTRLSWLQTSNTLSRHRNRSSSSLLNPTLSFVLLPVVALLLVVLVPSLLSFASQSFRPISVKKNWNSLSLLLVLFAIACGFLDKNNDDSSSSSSSINTYESTGVDHRVAPEDPLQSTLASPPPPSPPQPRRRPPQPALPPAAMKQKTTRTFHRVERKEKAENAHEVVSESKRSRLLQPPSPPRSPPPPQPILASHHRSEQKSGRNDKRGSGAKDIANTHQHMKEKKQKCKDTQDTAIHLSPPSSSHSGSSPLGPPPPPPPPLVSQIFKSSRNKTFKTSSLKMTGKFLSSSVSAHEKTCTFLSFSVSYYKEPSENEGIHSVPLSQLEPSPHPPPRRPASSSRSSKQKSQPEAPSGPPPTEPSSDTPQQRRRRSAAAGGRPPLPEKRISKLYDGEENLNSGGQSQLIPMPEQKFVVRGGGGRIPSNQNSRSSSPVASPTKKEPESVSGSVSTKSTSTTSTNTLTAAATMEGGYARSVFSPSPDVNAKAGTFITLFRAGLKLEEIIMNSIKEKKCSAKSKSKFKPKSDVNNQGRSLPCFVSFNW